MLTVEWRHTDNKLGKKRREERKGEERVLDNPF